MSQAVATHPTIDFRWHTYGKWLAMGPSEEPGKAEFRVCRCACGTVAEIHYLALVEGRAKSCGCDCVDYGGRNFKDMTGQLFGKWLVLQRAENAHGQARWLCRCLECEHEKVVYGLHLRQGKSRKCHGCKNVKVLPQRWVGSRFNLGRIRSRKGTGAFYRMQCLCGRTEDIRGNSLRSGTANTCSCQLTEPVKGKYFGFWYVLTLGGKTRNGEKTWTCQCICGFIRDVAQSELFTGNSCSCGCRGKVCEIGAVFGRLTVLASVGRGRWRCCCVCNDIEVIVSGALLRHGRKKSCGNCLQRGVAA